VLRRAAPGDPEVPTSTQDPNVVSWGGPKTASDIPLIDPTLPVTSVNRDVIVSYGENCWVYDAPQGVQTIQNRPTSLDWRKIDAAPHPSETPMFADAMWRGGGPDVANTVCDLPVPAAAHALPDSNGQWIDATHEFMHFAISRHSKGIEVLMFDGSVHYERARQLWRLYWHKQFDVNYADSQGAGFFPAWMP
jgi:hypothetical protein